MKAILILLSFIIFSFPIDSKTTKSDKKKIDFEKPVVLEGRTQSFKNSCIPGFGRPAKLFDEFLKLQTKLILLYKKINKIKAEHIKINKKNSRLQSDFDRLNKENNLLLKELNRSEEEKNLLHKESAIIFLDKDYSLIIYNDSIARDYNHLISESNKISKWKINNDFKKTPLREENDRLNKEFNRINNKLNTLERKYRKLEDKSNLLQFDSMRLQKMFYLSLRLEPLSMYSLTELVKLFENHLIPLKKQIAVSQKMIPIMKEKTPIIKTSVNLVKKIIPLHKESIMLSKKHILVEKKIISKLYQSCLNFEVYLSFPHKRESRKNRKIQTRPV